MAVRESEVATEGKRASGDLQNVVAIGASAGGLEALQELLGPVPLGTRSAFVVAQHLAPDRTSMLVDLLARSTKLAVVPAQDQEELSVDTVYVGPPNHDITVSEGRLRLLEPGERYFPSPSIDLLFESLAEHWQDRAVAVVLSGTGSDGAHGLRLVRAAGGLTMVQAPATARFDGMPRAAVALGGVELMGSPGDLALRLSGLTPELREMDTPSSTIPGPDMLATIAAQVKRHVGIDFSRYKESTVRRQVRRRMAVRQVDDADDYFALLAEDPDEAHALSVNLLVTVTSFFRDAEAFVALRTQLADYLAQGREDEQLRVWVPGCATGEEVYSIAMVVSDLLGHPGDLARRLKIFGTDLDDASLAIARRAQYPASAFTRIPEEYRGRLVSASADGLHVAEVLRECTVFARHDVGDDPPFPRMDLISCRNTLIYFTTPLQDRILQLFAYSLRPGGLLFLGRSESPDKSTVGFAAVDAEHRIFARTDVPAKRPEITDAGRASRMSRPSIVIPREGLTRDPIEEDHTRMLEALVRSLGTPCVVLDEGHNLVEVVGDVSAYCRIPEGQVTTAVASFLREDLQDEARALFLLCRADGSEVTGQHIHLAEPGIDVRLQVRPLRVGDRTLAVLAFLREAEVVRTTGSNRTEVFDREIKRLETELLSSQERMIRSLSELQAANEELEASSEEMQAASEELQAANEELEASNEELRATNEELGTLNQQLRVKGDELQQLNTDLENILTSMSQGLIIVNSEKQVARYSPLAVRVFALLESDLGTSLTAVPTTLEITGLEDALNSVILGGPRCSIECGDSSVSYLIQVLPYEDRRGGRQGAIVTLTDITELVALRTKAQEAFDELQEKAELLRSQATYDALTGLLNRGRFTEALTGEITKAQRSGARLALVAIDLDRFKEVNDAQGHEAGDLVLRSSAERLVDSVRATDIVGRIGGDEFAVIINGYDVEAELDAILDRMVLALRAPLMLRDWSLAVSGSLGVALFPEDETSTAGLMRAADAAMYESKRQSGDGYAYFDASMNEAAETRRDLRRRIDRGISDGEFCLYYQPIVSAESRDVWGVEALLRWNRGDRILSAQEFISFCDESGQIRPLGLVALGLFRADMAALREAGHRDLLGAVNMSVSQLLDPRLVELLDSWPAPQGLEGIVIEVVESVFLPEHIRGLGLLGRFTALGAKVSIDDYGSGYSNFQLLKALSPAYIKLDRSFLDVVDRPGAREALIQSAVEMSHVWGAAVIAEGVEDSDAELLVRELGVEYLQGYAIARPMPLDDLLRWLSERGP